MDDAWLFARTAELRGSYLCLAVYSGAGNFYPAHPPLNLQCIAELAGDANLDGARTPAMLFGSDPLPVPLALADD
jgi:hypothetical protein